MSTLNINGIDLTDGVNRIDITLPKPTLFFAHARISDGRITGISSQRSNTEDVVSIEIDKALAIDFLTGKKRAVRWVVTKQDGEFVLIEKKQLLNLKYERVDCLVMQELSEQDINEVDIRVEIGKEKGAVLIHFNGENIHKWKQPAKLYITAEANPAFLKCAFTLDVNILNEITSANGLSEWPNPLVLRIAESDDISVYTPKSDIKMIVARYS